MLYFAHLYDKYDKVIHELLSIFIVMLNNVKIELINATENCMSNIKNCQMLKILVCQLNCALPILFSLGQDQGV